MNHNLKNDEPKNRVIFADSYEKINCIISKDVAEGSLAIANMIADEIRNKQREGKQCVLGLATGSTPKTVYAELVRMHKMEGLSFKNVISFNLDEYYPIQKNAPQSFHSYMNRHLFSHIDILQENINIPEGMLSHEDAKKHAEDYENKIAALGGIDIQILGIGLNGHIGFNEPGSGMFSKTRLVKLTHSTRQIGRAHV